VSGFDLHHKHAILISLVIITLYTSLTIHEIELHADWPDYDFMRKAMMSWEPADVLNGFDYHAKYAMSKFSHDTLQNGKTIPFVLTISLLVVSYLFAVQLSGKNYAGVIAVCVIAGSSVFRQFDTSMVYDNSWVVFFMASLYFVKRKWQLNPVFFVLSVLSKSLTILFLPAILFYILRSDQSRKNKIVLMVFYGLTSLAFVAVSQYVGDYSDVPFNTHGFLNGLGAWVWFFMVPDFWLAVLMPLGMVMLLFQYKKNVKALPLLVLLCNLAFYGAFLEGFTDDIWNEPYRYIPLLAVFACSIGVITNGINLQRLRTDTVKV
jgi:hypothetical protein